MKEGRILVTKTGKVGKGKGTVRPFKASGFQSSDTESQLEGSFNSNAYGIGWAKSVEPLFFR